MRKKMPAYNRLARLEGARRQLLNIRDQITPAVAPKTARKIRSALKSIDGAIRNADRRFRKEARQ